MSANPINPMIHFHSSRSDAAGKAWQETTGQATLLLRNEPDETRLFDLVTRKRIQSWRDPLEALHWLSDNSMMMPGRWVGYVSYDLGYLLESIGSTARNDLQLPLFVFAFIPRDTSRPDLPLKSVSDALPGKMRSTFTQDAYEHLVEHAKGYIGAGDIFQINLSQRLTLPTTLSPINVYQQLIQQSPAAYGAMLDFGDFVLVSNSPELFVHVDPQANGNRRIITRPIKGTRPRIAGMETELQRSIKDQAELNMIVDLERNDLGRVCTIGSVRVSEMRMIEAHPTVYHGVATIEGLLSPEVKFVDLLAAMFPGGSVTGAPKIRAMQLIDQLEPVRRGPYCGAIGYLDTDGSMQFNLAIRTMILKDGLAHIYVGGGIVADSVPAEEYQETLVKAQAMLRAVGATV